MDGYTEKRGGVVEEGVREGVSERKGERECGGREYFTLSKHINDKT